MIWHKKAEERLVKACMEDWQRRGAHLLQLGLHSPVVPEFFWDSGFDVTCCEENHAAAEAALARSGPRISYQIGRADHLPFDDDSFEYAFVSLYADTEYVGQYGLPFFLRRHMQEKLPAVLEELCRVSRLGVVLTAKNACSLCQSRYEGKKYSPYFLWKTAKGLCSEGRVRFASTGFVPRLFTPRLQFVNNAVSFVPCGALVGCCLEFNVPPLTGIGAFIKQEKRKLENVPLIQRNG